MESHWWSKLHHSSPNWRRGSLLLAKSMPALAPNPASYLPNISQKGRDCGLSLVQPMFTSSEKVDLTLAESQSLHFFRPRKVNQINAPTIVISPSAAINVADSP